MDYEWEVFWGFFVCFVFRDDVFMLRGRGYLGPGFVGVGLGVGLNVISVRPCLLIILILILDFCYHIECNMLA